MITTPLSESAVAVTFGDTIDLETHRKVMASRDLLLEHPFPGMVSVVPAYASLTVFFDPLKVRKTLREKQQDTSLSPAALAVCDFLYKTLKGNDLYEPGIDAINPKRASQAVTSSHRLTEYTLEIPVRYDGPDLPEVAEYLQLPVGEVIRLHSEAVYTVFMTGFLPGFPYLGPLPAALELPRRDTPRLRVPAGSVAIAGRQTGIYPQASPGGWRLIGSTNISLFDPALDPPALLRPGMKVRFANIGPNPEFSEIQ